jgi:hypothetical protein
MATRRKKEEPAERTEICKHCRHALFDADAIQCRRFPPIPVFDIPNAEVLAFYPTVAADAWCGEFAAELNS